MVLVFKRVSGSTYRSLLFSSSTFKCVRPCQPRRRPNTSQLFSVARYVTSLITELRPGTSPPPVSMPIRLVDMVGGRRWGVGRSSYLPPPTTSLFYFTPAGKFVEERSAAPSRALQPIPIPHRLPWLAPGRFPPPWLQLDLLQRSGASRWRRVGSAVDYAIRRPRCVR